MSDYVANRAEAETGQNYPGETTAPGRVEPSTPTTGALNWPPLADKARLRNYDTCRDLYQGDHKDVYVRASLYSYDKDRPYVPLNLCGEITDLMVDRLFGVMPRITAGGRPDGNGASPPSPLSRVSPDAGEPMGEGGNGVDPVDGWIDRLVTRSRMHSLLLRLATGTSYCGDGALKVRWTKERGTTISTVSPSYLYLTTDPDDTDTTTEALIGYLRWQGKTAYLFHEIHTAGLISYRLYQLHGGQGSSSAYKYNPAVDQVPLDTLPSLEGWPDDQTTGVDDLLVIPIALGGDDEGGVYGRSDYADIFGLQGELNNRLTQRAEVLDKHANPWMFGPGIADEEGKIKQGDRYIQIQNGEVPPGYLIWDSAMQAVREEINDLVSEIILTAGLSPESFQLAMEGAAESGRALKLRQFRTASAVLAIFRWMAALCSYASTMLR